MGARTITEMPLDSKPSLRIVELDGLRAIAVALVIGCHYPVVASSFWGLPELGWLGVEIFFVLSGYLITTILLRLRGREDAYEVFYARRARRIVPPYFLVLSICVMPPGWRRSTVCFQL